MSPVVRLWDVTDDAAAQQRPRHFDPYGQPVAEPDNDRLKRRYAGSADAVYGVAFSHVGRLAAAAACDTGVCPRHQRNVLGSS